MTFFTKIKTYIRTHKKTSIFLLIIIISIGYWAIQATSKSNAETQYVLAAAKQGNIVSVITGSGQVSASNEVSLTSKASGEIIHVAVTVGQQVRAGALIAQVDPGNARFEVENAQLAYDELVTIDPDELRKAQDALEQAQEALEKDYVDARAKLVNSTSALSDTLENVDILLSDYLSTSRNDVSKKEKEYITKAEESYYASDKALDSAVKKARAISNSTDDETIRYLIGEIRTTALLVSETVKYIKDAVVYLRNGEDDDNDMADANEAYASVNTLSTSMAELISEVTTLQTTIANDSRILVDAKITLDDIRNGPDALELRQQELTLRQKQESYSDYFVRAPFDGVVASLEVQKGDTTSGTIATLISKQKIANITLNEVDVASVSIGQKALLMFDAVEDLTISGTVAEVDLVGTVEQGVVNYNVKISFDSDSDQIKSGMSTSASITTDTKENVLVVPSSAVKTAGKTSYVEVVSGDGSVGRPVSAANVVLERRNIVVGTSDDTNVEIVSGLEEGERVVARTIAQSTTTTPSGTTTPPSLFGGGNAPRGATGGMMISR